MSGSGITEKYRPQRLDREPAGDPPHQTRSVYWREIGGRHDTPVWARDSLPVGFDAVGPAIVEQMDSTTVVPPGVLLVVDEYGNLLLQTVTEGAA